MLACFGGAGGQHACAIARALGMDSVFIHKYGRHGGGRGLGRGRGLERGRGRE